MTPEEADRYLWQMYRSGLISKPAWTRATREVRRAATQQNKEEACSPTPTKTPGKP